MCVCARSSPVAWRSLLDNFPGITSTIGLKPSPLYKKEPDIWQGKNIWHQASCSFHSLNIVLPLNAYPVCALFTLAKRATTPRDIQPSTAGDVWAALV